MLKRANLWAWVAFLLVIVAVCWAPTGQRFPGALLSAFVFAAVLSWLPKCRPVLNTPLCPWNWALLLFFVQLIVMPLSITLNGPTLGVLPFLPSPLATNMAMVLYSLAFLPVCLVYSHFARFRTTGAAWLDRLRTLPDTRNIGSARQLAIFVLAGIAGVFLAFGSVASVLDYYRDPVSYHDYFLDLSSTWRGLGAMLLKPFLGFAVVMAWCRWIDSAGVKSSSIRRGLVMILVLVGVAVSFSLFNFNRGSIAVPLLAVGTVALVKGDKFSWRIMAVSGVLVLVLTPVLALYRSGTGGDLQSWTDLQDSVLERIDIPEVAQMYGGAPQYLGFLLEGSHWGSDPRWGVVTISSILAPIAVIGKSFRRNSGYGIYNRMLYSTDAIVDQNPPFQAESFLDFHIVGVLFGSAIFGWVLHRLQRAFERSRSSMEIYIWQYLSVWTCFLIFGFAGLNVQSQVMCYYCWPIYAYWYSRKRSRLPVRVQATANQEA
jgi:oligosaccharide repeat unit polymerase